MDRRRIVLFSILFSHLLGIAQASAQSLPNNFTVEGRLYDKVTSLPINSATVTLKLEVVNDSNPACVLYRETTAVLDLSSASAASQGVFSVPLGSGTPDPALLPTPTLEKVFSNVLLSGLDAVSAPCSVTPAAGEHRLVRINVSTDGGATWDTLAPDTRVTPVPSAMVADSLQGMAPTSFIQVNTTTSQVTQPNLDTIFTNVNFPKLIALLAGSSGSYMPGTPTAAVSFNGQQILNVAAPTAGTSAVNRNYADANLGGALLDVSGVASGVGGGRTLTWDSVAAKWKTSSSASAVSSIAGGTGLLGGTITSNGTISVDVGTTAGKIVQLTAGAQLPAVDGFLLTNITGAVSSVAGRTGVVTLNAADIGGLGTAALKAFGVAGNNLVELNASAQLPAVDAFLLSNVNAVKLQSRNVASSVPVGGDVLTWNAANVRWEPSATVYNAITALTGDVTATGNGSVAATITNNSITTVKIADNSLTSAKINSSGNTANQLLVTDGITGATVTYANSCAVGEVLKWTLGGWVCSSDLTGGAGTVTSVVAGNGLSPKTITGTGTLSVDVGVSASKILQLTAGAQIPAVDGNLVSNVNAAKLQARNVSNAAPVAGNVLGWNAVASHWEPMTAAVGSVTSLVAGNGIVPNTVTSNGTLNIDTGTSANKIVQITGGTQYPAVDGNLISNINAVKMQSRNISNAAPVTGQVLAWNGALVQWEPLSVGGTGTVSLVNAGVGLVGATITASGTINVDVGTTANKIMQLNNGAQIPAVDGNLVSNVNAVKLQTRDVSNAAPSAGKVLGWNALSTMWEPLAAATGSVQTVISGSGLVPNTFTTNGTINVDVGVTGGKIVQLNGGAQLPAVDGNLVTNVNAVKLQTRDVSNAIPGAGNVLGWNVVATRWEPTTLAFGSVSAVVAGSGIIPNTITGNGTLNVDVGTTANKIVQFTGGAQYPAVDGNLISNVNSAKLQARDVLNATPTNAQYLGWNTVATRWEPMSGSNGSVTSVVAGAGIVPNTITGNGTLAVDVGTTSGKVLQLTGGAQIPAVDGFLVTNVNAVQNVFFGTGVVPTTITRNGTINVDVGTSANKILQLDSGAQIPAVDGNLVSNVNAVKLQTREVYNTAPGAGQFLGWNTVANRWEPMNSPTSQWTTAGSDVYYSTGNVGIGTSTPGGALQVTIPSSGTTGIIVKAAAGQSSNIQEWQTSAGVVVNRISSTGALQALSGAAAAPSISFISGPTTGLFYPGSANIGFTTAGTERMRVDQLGNIGIGTSTPPDKLSLYSGLNSQIAASIATSGTGVAQQALLNLMTYQSGTTSLGTSNTTRGWQFWANGNAHTGGGSPGDFGLSFFDGANYNDVFKIGGGNSNSSGAGAITLLTGPTAATVARMTIDTVGNVGIGTTTPQAILDVNGTGTVQSAMIVPRETTALRPYGVNGMIRYNNNTSKFEAYESGAWRNMTTSASGFANGGNAFGATASLGTTDITNLNFLTCNNVQMTVTSQGNVGIGTTTPATLLAVSGSSGLNPTGLGALQTVAQFGAANGNSTNVVVDAYGTASGPALNLRSSEGTAAAPSALFFGDGLGTLGFKGYGSTVYSGTRAGVRALAAENWTDTTEGTHLTFLTTTLGSTSLLERMRIDSAGNVGIGTTTPRGALDLNGSGTASSSMIVPRDTLANRPSSTAVNGMLRYDNNTGKFEAFAAGAWGNIDLSSGSSGAFVNGGNAFGATANLGTTDITNLNFLTCNNVQMTINSQGNVGIGTTLPASRFEVDETRRETSGFASTLYMNQLIQAPAASSAMYVGSDNVTTTFSNASNYTGPIYGVRAYVGHTGSGTVSTMNGIASTVNASGAGTILAASGFDGSVSSSATIGNAYGGKFSVAVTAGTTNSAYGSYSDISQTGGTLINGYGIYVGSITATNKWSFYASDATAPSYFAGRVGIGTTIPTGGTTLDLAGTGTQFSSLLIPRDTTALRPYGVNGMIRYNTNTGQFEGYGNGIWANVVTSSNAIVNGGNAFGGPTFIGTTDLTNLNFLTCNNAQMTITSNGKVGIGTTTPSTKLDVQGTIKSFAVDASGGLVSNVATPVAATDAANKAYVDAVAPSNSKISLFEDFYSTGSLTANSFAFIGTAAWTSSATGPAAAPLPGATNLGVMRITTVITVSQLAGLGFCSNNGTIGQFFGSGSFSASDPWTFEIRINSSSYAVTNQNILMGLLPSNAISYSATAGAETNSGVYFYTTSASSTVSAVSRSGATSVGGTTWTGTTGGWDRWTITYDGAGTAKFYQNGLSVSTVNTNIPTGTSLCPSIRIINNGVAPSAPRTIDVDYISYTQTLSTPR